MRRIAVIVASLLAVCPFVFAEEKPAAEKSAASAPAAPEAGWVVLFDGKTLTGWDGDPKFWSITDGAITGTTTKENPTKGNTFIIYVGDNADKKPVEFGDFELKVEYRIIAHNSGIQYRSFKLGGDGWRIGGYQADIDAKNEWSGTNYGEAFRGILAKRGEKATLTTTAADPATKKKAGISRQVESLGDAKKLAEGIKPAPEWNEYHIIARGNHLIQKINGVTMSEVIDNDAAQRAKGLLALQLHAGPPMSVQFRSIQIKKLDKE